MRGTIRKIGRSSVLVVPDGMLAELGAKAGDEVVLFVENGRLSVVPAGKGPRAGWAADAMRLADVGDDALVWPEIGDDGDCTPPW